MSNPSAATSPKIHRVVLDYVVEDPSAEPELVATVRVTPETVRVNKGDTLHFRKGVGPEGATVRITFSDAGPFSAPKNEGNDQIFSVTSDLKRRVTYDCELVKNGKVVAASHATRAVAAGGGGNVEPASGDRGA